MTVRRAALLVLAVTALAVPRATLSGASFTSRSTNPVSSASSAVDWTPPKVTLTDPGPAVRGTVVVRATAADDETGVAQIVLSWAPDGTSAWTTLCTVAGAAASCPLATTSLPDEEIDLRAVATDQAGEQAMATVTGVLVDNAAPHASLTDPGSPLRGTVVLSTTSSDAGAGVGSVIIQVAPAGTTSWGTVCSAVAAPWSCSWDTTAITYASYDLRAVVADIAGNVTTTSTVRNRTVDNRVASVSVTEPGALIQGTVTLGASALSPSGVSSVRIQRTATGSTTAWVDVCTDASSPYQCSWNSATVADGPYSFRAVMVEVGGKTTTSAVVGPRAVDNSPVRGADVQAVNSGTLGTIGSGDRLMVTYDDLMKTGSFLSGWDGSARAVVVRVRDGSLVGGGSSNDTVDVFTSTNYQTPVALGSVDLRVNQIRSGRTVALAATLTQETIVVSGVSVTRVTVTIGSVVQGGAGQLRNTSSSGTMVWTPSSGATDVNGVACSVAPISETGSIDRDL